VLKTGSTLVEGFHLGRSMPVGSLPLLSRLDGRVPGLTEVGVGLVALDIDFLPDRLVAGSLERKGKYESRLRVEPVAESAGRSTSSEIFLLSGR
jgi:hypothetical protein